MAATHLHGTLHVTIYKVDKLRISNGGGNIFTKAHIRELQEEVKLLKNLSHPNTVRH